jgi:phosphoribosylformylglycinamidine cyclo-ligase
MDQDKSYHSDETTNIDARKQVVRNVQPITDSNNRPEVLSGVGGFAGLFELDRYANPVMVSSAEGIGSKLIVANLANKHDTIGIDLVAMCVNDLITYGAEPLFFLDYLSTSKLDVDKSTRLIKGIIEGCKLAGCSLIGGETLEMPGMFTYDHYALAGFVCGVVEKDNIIETRYVASGDVIIGLASSGLHCSGFKLCKQIFFDKYRLSPHGYIDFLHRPLFEELLEPTKMYVEPVLEITRNFKIKAMAHVKQGGLIESIPRSLPFEYQANIYSESWDIPKLFKVIQTMSELSTYEMFKIFNMGIGMIMVVEEHDSDKILKKLDNLNCEAYRIGKVTKKKSVERVVIKDNK